MPPSPPTRLQVTGSLTTHSDPTFGTGCAFNDFAKGRVRFVSGPMLLPSGGALRLGMDVVPAVGSQAADHPLVLGIRTPVGIQQYTTSASGAMLGDWLATSGVVTISSVHDLGLSDRWGMMSGTIDADLAQSGGAKPLHVTGSWGCVVDPVLS